MRWNFFVAITDTTMLEEVRGVETESVLVTLMCTTQQEPFLVAHVKLMLRSSMSHKLILIQIQELVRHRLF